MIYQGITLLDHGPEDLTGVACPHCGSVDNWALQYCDLQGTQPCSGGDNYDSYNVHDFSLVARYATCAECDGLVWFDPEWFLSAEEVKAALDAAMDCHATIPNAAYLVIKDALGARLLGQMDWAVEAAKVAVSQKAVAP